MLRFVAVPTGQWTVIELDHAYPRLYFIIFILLHACKLTAEEEVFLFDEGLGGGA
jgi:hypothetical protein